MIFVFLLLWSLLLFYTSGICVIAFHDTSISSLYLYDSSLFCQFGALFLIDQVILVQHRPRISSRYGAEVEIGLRLRLLKMRIFMMIIFRHPEYRLAHILVNLGHRSSSWSL